MNGHDLPRRLAAEAWCSTWTTRSGAGNLRASDLALQTAFATRDAAGRLGMGFFDVQTTFFRPLWRRIAATTVCLVWAVVELATGAVMWAMLFGAASAYLAWQFFVVFRPPPDNGGDRT